MRVASPLLKGCVLEGDDFWSSTQKLSKQVAFLKAVCSDAIAVLSFDLANRQ